VVGKEKKEKEKRKKKERKEKERKGLLPSCQPPQPFAGSTKRNYNH